MRLTTPETKSKISLRNKGVSVKIWDKLNNFVQEFPTLTRAAKFLGVSTKTISRIYQTGESFDDLIYEFNIKDNRIWVYDINQQLVNIFDNAKKTTLYLNIPRSTLSDYIKSPPQVL